MARTLKAECGCCLFWRRELPTLDGGYCHLSPPSAYPSMSLDQRLPMVPRHSFCASFVEAHAPEDQDKKQLQLLQLSQTRR
ncbi:MAG: hypothetical protein AB8G14_09240 [Ilumatobacter sp.]